MEEGKKRFMVAVAVAETPVLSMLEVLVEGGGYERTNSGPNPEHPVSSGELTVNDRGAK